MMTGLHLGHNRWLALAIGCGRYGSLRSPRIRIRLD